MQLGISPWNSSNEGVIYAAQAQAAGLVVRRSTDYGLTWSSYVTVVSGDSVAGRGGILVPYKYNSTENRNGANQRIIVFQGRNGNSSSIRVYRGTTLEATYSSPNANIIRAANTYGYRGFHAFTYEGTRIMAAGYNNIDGTVGQSMWSIVDEVAAQTAGQPNGISGSSACFGEVTGFSYHSDWILIYAPGSTAKGTSTGISNVNQTLQYSPDFGTTWYGNAPAGWTGNLVAHAEALLTDFQ